jgi:hypothetical protein
MSYAAPAPSEHPTPHLDAPNTISVPFVIAAAALIGAGLFAISQFLVTFNYLYFGGVALVFLGAMMMLSPRAGSDHA